MPYSPTVLLFTTDLWGQAGIHLATSFELALAGANVYVSSTASLGSRVRGIQELVARRASRSGSQITGSVSFHEYRGIIPFWDVLGKHGINSATLPHPHGFFGTWKHYTLMKNAVLPWDFNEHFAAVATAKEIIATIKPHVVVIDITLAPAVDACKLVGQKFMIFSPNAIKDIATATQPNLAVFWKYPAPSSGFPFPLKWWQIPLNIILLIKILTLILMAKQPRKISAARNSLGISKSISASMYPGVKYLSASLPETDFPFVIPKELIPCGPIVIPFDPVEETDPTLMTWLNNGPTVLVNLGSLLIFDEKAAKEMAGAFRILLDYHERKGSANFQVFWKAKATSDIRNVIENIIGKEIKEGRVKIVAWVDVEPVSILQHPNVLCTVHHGGANSFYEGVWSGLPHIVLPVWADTYEFARRAEFLNIGVFANKNCAPGVQAVEFGEALTKVTGYTYEAEKFRSAAKRLKNVCEAKGNGRKLASKAILEEIAVARGDSFR